VSKRYAYLNLCNLLLRPKTVETVRVFSNNLKPGVRTRALKHGVQNVQLTQAVLEITGHSQRLTWDRPSLFVACFLSLERATDDKNRSSVPPRCERLFPGNRFQKLGSKFFHGPLVPFPLKRLLPEYGGAFNASNSQPGYLSPGWMRQECQASAEGGEYSGRRQWVYGRKNPFRARSDDHAPKR
jgi:hypothetical protein